MRFSEERELFAAAATLPHPPLPPAEQPTLRSYWRPLSENRWAILLAVLAATATGVAITVATPPAYEANLLIQIADSVTPSKGVLGETASVFDIKTPATAEMEIMRSRMIVGPAVDANDLRVVARPRYLPFLVPGPARDPAVPSGDNLFGSIRRWLQGERSITVGKFEVPQAWEGQRFVVTRGEGGRYTLRHPSLAAPLEGRVGEVLSAPLGKGRLALLVSDLKGPDGSDFTVMRKSRAKATENLQEALQLSERGRQSGIIEVSLKDTDPARAAAVLNAIGASYVKQAVDRKTAEAEKSLAFLNTQLPSLKDQMERAEGAYNRFRSRSGTVSFDDDARIALQRSYELKGKLADAEQKKRDLLSDYGAQHPAVRIVDEQIAGLQREVRNLQGRLSAIPGNQQDAQRLERDAKMSGDLYQQFRSNALHLQLVREGLTGNARIIDNAIAPEDPVRPQPAIVIPAAAAAGLALSLLVVFLRSGLARGVRTVREIESATGLSVYSASVPFSSRGRRDIVALAAPDDEASLALRQLRTLLQHQVRGRANNRVLLTGPSEGVGVHFIAANVAAVMASAGQRVLLVDADRQNGRLHRMFGLGNDCGLTELVAGACTRKDAVQSTRIAGLDLVAAGGKPTDFGDLATSRAFTELLDQASRDYDAVIVTAAPVLRSAETLSLALTASMVVLVARARRTAVDDVAQSARRLTQAGQVLSGVVLNGV